MRHFRHTAKAVSLLLALAVLSCTDADPAGPSVDLAQDISSLEHEPVTSPRYEAPGFLWLTPIADGNPTIDSDFNPDLLPAIRLCRLATGFPENGAVCESQALDGQTYLPLFGAGEATVGNKRYEWGWDTGTVPWSRKKDDTYATDRYFQLQVVIGSKVLGHVNLDPQNPNGPGQSDEPETTFSFKAGETIPLKAFTSVELFCEPDRPEVLECETNQIIDAGGGYVYLDGSGVQKTLTTPPAFLSVRVPANSLPDGVSQALFTLRRLDLDLIDQDDQYEDCIPGLDVGVVGECFNVETSLENGLLKQEPEARATVSVCLAELLPLTESVDPNDPRRALQLVKYSGETGIYETLARTDGLCDAGAGTVQAVSGTGAAAFIDNTMEFGFEDDGGSSDEVGIRLGGLTSSFSKIGFAPTGQVFEDPDGPDAPVDESSIQQVLDGTDVTKTVALRVIDRIGDVEIPIQGATLQVTSISTFDQSGTAVTITGDALGSRVSDIELPATLADGTTSVDWYVDDDAKPGPRTLTLSALGVATADDPDPRVGEEFGVEEFTVAVTVVGPPDDASASPTFFTGGTVGEEAGEVTVTVWDENDVAIPGATIVWAGDGSVEFCETNETTGDESCTTTTGADGTTTVTWTYGTTSGSQTLTFSVPNTEAGGSVTNDDVGAGLPVSISVSPSMTYRVGGGDQITVNVDLVADEFGNPVGAAGLMWTTDDGSISPETSPTAADGAATATWTLPAGPLDAPLNAPLTAQVSVDGTSPSVSGTFEATTGCLIGFGTATVDGAEGPTEWECATPGVDIEVNLGGGQSTPAVLRTMNDDENVYFLLDVPEGTGADVFSLRFDFDSDYSGGATAGDDVLGYDADTEQLIDGYLSAQCANRSQSKCYVTDGNGQEQLLARVGKEGVRTIYELSHPLNSGDTNPDGLSIDIAAVDATPIPYFITLSNGGGAKGNTQFPGFRDYSKLSFMRIIP